MALTLEEKRKKMLASVLKKIASKMKQRSNTISKQSVLGEKQAKVAEALRVASDQKIIARLTKTNNGYIAKLARYDLTISRLNDELVKLDAQKANLGG